MRTATLAVRIEWFDNPERPQIVPLAQFVAENREDPDMARDLESMRRGEVVIVGGVGCLPPGAMWIEEAA